MKQKFKVDTEKCVKCGLCVNDCITKAIATNENGIPEMYNSLRCIECQHCFAICPQGAISILEKNPDESNEIHEINSEDILNLIKSRRSIRKYRQENVSKEIITKLKSMLNYSPTGCNSHKLHFSFIEDMDVMDDFRTKVNEKIVSILTKKPFEILAEKVSKFTKYKKAFLEGKDVIFRGAPHLIVACAPIDSPCPTQDGIIALSYFELYAKSLGLGTLWCGYAQTVLKLFPEFCEYSQIPKGYQPIYVMLFGYSDVKYQRTIQPLEYSFKTIEKQDIETGIITKLKRFFWNCIR